MLIGVDILQDGTIITVHGAIITGATTAGDIIMDLLTIGVEDTTVMATTTTTPTTMATIIMTIIIMVMEDTMEQEVQDQHQAQHEVSKNHLET